MQFSFQLMQCSDHLAPDCIGTHIVGAELDDAGLLALRRREDRAEIKVVRQNHEVVGQRRP